VKLLIKCVALVPEVFQNKLGIPIFVIFLESKADFGRFADYQHEADLRGFKTCQV